MKLTVTTPENVSYEYTLTDSAPELLADFVSGRFVKIELMEAAPYIHRLPMRFRLEVTR